MEWVIALVAFVAGLILGGVWTYRVVLDGAESWMRDHYHEEHE